jgi:hypothetical protein
MGRRSILFFICALGSLLVALPGAAATPGISLNNMSPASAYAGASVECTIQGRFFAGRYPEFSLVRGATTIVGRTTGWDTSRGRWAKWAKATFALPSGTAPGSYDLHAVQVVGPPPVSEYAASLASAFQVLNTALVLTSTNPTSVAAGSRDLTLTVYGGGFVPIVYQPPSIVPVLWSKVFWNGR